MTITTPYRRKLVLFVAAALIAAGAVAWLAARPATDSNTAPAMETRVVQAGSVEVTMTPLTLDRSGAVFEIKLDTHSVELDQDLAASARLRIGDQQVESAVWEGPGSGGHHREGQLRFSAEVPAGAAVELRLTGFASDVAGTWTAP
ncbi:hypothetical protein [Actinokineospora xionganensis]|uniref:DUF4352 domain-containing protein n=1 Tax=Actinokineospora xionganensis TaxID=2684470 RepID=A0ABR7L0C7_9PSEU|nr:hypothetical protein [Actinokineospora xionganensis]MBC6445836.1 hypothetical protein [Actinokineospora xionganensis]